MDLSRLMHALLALCLLSSAPAQASPDAVLYRCVAPGEVPRWQDRPCPFGQEQRTMAFVPEPADAAPPPRAPKPAASKAPRRASASTTSRTRARVPDRARAGCEQARTLARLRTDADGRRVPVRTIRAREADARKVCAR